MTLSADWTFVLGLGVLGTLAAFLLLRGQRAPVRYDARRKRNSR